MASTANDAWVEAMNVETYLNQMTLNGDLFEQRILSTAIPDKARSAFSGSPMRILILTEDFCGDSAQFIPPLIRLAQESDDVEIRILLRDTHRDLAARYVRKDGYQAIPVLIFLDGHGDERGYLVERPARAHEELAAESRRFAKENQHLDDINRTYDKMPAETRAAVAANANRFRNTKQQLWTEWLFDEIEELLAVGSSSAQIAAG